MPGIPVCVYEPTMGMFRVTLSRGKVLFSGGFGIAIPSALSDNLKNKEGKMDTHDDREKHRCGRSSSRHDDNKKNDVATSEQGNGNDSGEVDKIGSSSFNTGEDSPGNVVKKTVTDYLGSKSRTCGTVGEEGASTVNETLENRTEDTGREDGERLENPVPVVKSEKLNSEDSSSNNHPTDGTAPLGPISNGKGGTILSPEDSGAAAAAAEPVSIAETTTADYLFPEEALFLHERGLLEVLPSNYNDDEHGKSKDNDAMNNPMRSPELFHLLERHGVPLACYLAYSHLRAQTFIVLRHCPAENSTDRSENDDGKYGGNENDDGKYGGNENDDSSKDVQDSGCESAVNGKGSLVISQNEKESRESSNIEQCGEHLRTENSVETWKEARNSTLTERDAARPSKRQIIKNRRKRLRYAPPPRMLHPWGEIEEEKNRSYEEKDKICGSDDSSDCNGGRHQLTPPTPIAFDVYNPNSNFRKSNPGLPDYCVVVTSAAMPSPPMIVFKDLLRTLNGVPLKIAAVSDGGTVLMFGMTDAGVPKITRK